MPRAILFSAVIAACLLATSVRAQNPKGLDFLADLPDFERVREMLPNHLNRIAISLLEERKRTVARISSAAEIAKRKVYIRERMLRALGGLPERTPLNARVVGVLDRDGYRVEKVVFESQPHFYVTGNLYVPKSGQPPYPAALFPLGASAAANPIRTGSTCSSRWPGEALSRSPGTPSDKASGRNSMTRIWRRRSSARPDTPANTP